MSIGAMGIGGGGSPFLSSQNQFQQDRMSNSNFLKHFNIPSVQIKNILRDKNPIVYESIDNVAYFGKGGAANNKAKDKPYIFLPQFSTDNPRALIEKRKKGEMLI